MLDKKIRDISIQLAAVLEKQKTAQLQDGAPSLEIRSDRLSRAIDILLNNKTKLQDAMIAVSYTHLRAHET